MMKVNDGENMIVMMMMMVLIMMDATLWWRNDEMTNGWRLHCDGGIVIVVKGQHCRFCRTHLGAKVNALIDSCIDSCEITQHIEHRTHLERERQISSNYTPTRFFYKNFDKKFRYTFVEY